MANSDQTETSQHTAGREVEGCLATGCRMKKYIYMDKFLEEKNPSGYLKYLTNHTVLGFPPNPFYRLDTRATE